MGLDLKALGKEIGRADLWNKTLGEFTEEEIRKLEQAFVRANIAGGKTCGSCWFYGFVKSDGHCFHVDHPGRVYVWNWNLGCRDYSYLFEKGTPNQPLRRAERL
jgi:hypothetical protein